MQVCRRFAAEYVAKHLHGLQVFSTLPVSMTSHHNNNNNNLESIDGGDHHHHNK